MTLRAVRGMAAVTLAVPFSVLVDVEGERASDPFYLDDWRDLYNSGLEPDALEGALMENADVTRHEVVDFRIESAEWDDKGAR